MPEWFPEIDPSVENPIPPDLIPQPPGNDDLKWIRLTMRGVLSVLGWLWPSATISDSQEIDELREFERLERIGWWIAADSVLEQEESADEAKRAVIGEREGELNGIENDPITPDQTPRIEFAAKQFVPPAAFLPATNSYIEGNPNVYAERLGYWRINEGWIRALMDLQADIYDIGLFDDRDPRGEFYACERRELGAYAKRIDSPTYWNDTKQNEEVDISICLFP